MSAYSASAKQDHNRRILPGQIFLKHEIDGSRAVVADEWHRNAVEDFSNRVGDNRFPCPFARKAWKAGTIRFLFIGSGQGRDDDDIHAGLTDYTDFVRNVDINDRLLAPLVVFFEVVAPASSSLHQIGWEALNRVHKMDLAPWPHAVPISPDDPKWCFCFNGVQLFINMSTPEHTMLQSRNLGRFLTFVVNPRENFDAVANMHSRSGRLLRQTIRDRVHTYNEGFVPAELGFYGDPDNREWLQYQLEEPGLKRPPECPFKP